MLEHRTLLLLAACLLVLLQAPALAVDWGSNVYDPGVGNVDQLPTDAATTPQWDSVSTEPGSFIETIENDYYRLDTATNSVNYNAKKAYGQSTGMDGLATTIEWEFRVVGLDNSGGDDAAWAMQHMFYIGAAGSGAGGVEWFQLLYDDTNLLITSSGDAEFLGGQDFTDWTTLRMTIAPQPGDASKRDILVYLNNDPTPVLTSWENVDTSNTDVVTGMKFGDYSASDYCGGIVDYRSIRWTPDGAFPAPEPTTMALMGLGGLALLRRRRR